MERQKPKNGQFYKHFKGNIYQIITIAKDSEEGKEKVVYQGMYEPYTCWVRDMEEFMSLVDQEKYPHAKQKYRFEQVSFLQGTEKEHRDTEDNIQPSFLESFPQKKISESELVKALKSGQPNRYLKDKMSEEEIRNQGLLQLLDAPTFHEKRQIFMGLHQYMTPTILSSIAVALDIVLEEGDVEEQYESILRCMDTWEHYEGGRLR